MANMSLKKNPMPSQDPNVRNKNFDEVALGYTEEQALDEATRCLNCKNKPCMQGCPVMVHIPDFFPARRLRPCLPPGEPVREVLRPRHQGRACGHRPSGALRGRLAP